ncbi:MAG: phosphate acyltransferase [Opitutaceae bacterium]|nr:phosphate acyltransferase [Opitutaceae bacterium]
MPFVAKLVDKLQRHPKRVVFPEGNDPRILQAARQWVSRRMGAPILLGNRSAIKDSALRLDLNMQGMRIIDPERSEEYAPFVEQLLEIRRNKGMTRAEAQKAVLDPSTFACLMVLNAQADAVVGGATRTAASVLRPLFQIIPRHEHALTAASLTVIDFDERKLGSDGTLFFADCGVVPDPTLEQLADIAVSTARVARHLTNEIPRVAFLSFTTKSDSSHPVVARMREAAILAESTAKRAGVEAFFEGELQADAALDSVAASVKQVGGEVAGRANVLIFPDLASGNIAFKLVHILAGANTYGQIITGLSRPAAEVSRGASAHDVFGTAAIVGCQAIDRHLLFGLQ